MPTQNLSYRVPVRAGGSLLLRARTIGVGGVSDWSANYTVTVPSAPVAPAAPEYIEASYYEIPIDSAGNTSLYIYAKILADESATGFDSVDNLSYRLDYKEADNASAQWVTGTLVPANVTETHETVEGLSVNVSIVEEPVPDFLDYEVRLSAVNSAGSSPYTYLSDSSSTSAVAQNGAVTL